jgi:hypothetical protein
MKKLFLSAAVWALASAAAAQSAGGFSTGQMLSAAALNAAFALKQDYGALDISALPPLTSILATDYIVDQPAAAGRASRVTASQLQNYVLTSVKTWGAVGDGVHDDTTAIQAALDSGLSVYMPPGIYKTTATLNVTHAKNDGQLVQGAGSYTVPDAFNTATYGNSAIIRPTSAVTVAILVDGTPIVGGGYQQSWVQNWQIKNVAVDMVNMADDASHVAYKQVQAWNVTVDHMTVINDGNYKRGWLLAGGAFGTTLEHPWGNIIDMEGVNLTYEVTTISINNPGVGKIIANYTGSVTVTGGAVQFPYQVGVTPIVWVPASAQTPYEIGDGVNGFYVAYGSDIANSQYFKVVGTDFEGYSQPPNTCTVVGWSYGTYNDDTHGCAKLVLGNLIESTSSATNFDDTQAAGAYFTDLGVGSVFTNFIQSGGFTYNVSKSIPYDLSDHYVGGTLYGLKNFGGAYGTGSNPWKIVGSTGVASFAESILRPVTDGLALYVTNAAGNATMGYWDTTGAGTLYVGGQALINSTVMQPATDGNLFYVRNAAGTNFMLCNSNSTIGLSNCAVGYGADWKGYSDNFTTQTYDFDASTGNITFTGQLRATGTAGVGYATGAGGAVTQVTSRTTGVTLNKPTGAITLFSAAGSTTPATFTVTDSSVAANDTVTCSQQTGANLYQCLVTGVAAGSFKLSVFTTGGVTVEAPVFNFNVMKGSAS